MLQGDEDSFGACFLTLRGLLLCLLLGLLLSVLLRKVSAGHAATDRTNDGMVPRIMTSDAADHRALYTARGVGRAYRCQGQRRCYQNRSSYANSHLEILTS